MWITLSGYPVNKNVDKKPLLIVGKSQNFSPFSFTSYKQAKALILKAKTDFSTIPTDHNKKADIFFNYW